jgi:hypothetical protein
MLVFHYSRVIPSSARKPGNVSPNEVRTTDLLLRVHTILDARLDWLSPVTRSVLAQLVFARGTYGDAPRFARSVGLGDRYKLAYALQRDGMPPLSTLANWIKVIVWLEEAETTGGSLCEAALSELREPSARYRLVKHLTGVPWTTLRGRGMVWLIEQFVSRCSRRQVTDEGSPAARRA